MDEAEASVTVKVLDELAADEFELILLTEGDKRIRWRKGSPSEAKAREEFEQKKLDGWLAFRMDSSGKKGRQVDTFDELADAEKGLMTRGLMVPAFRGG